MQRASGADRIRMEPARTLLDPHTAYVLTLSFFLLTIR
jgi:hypothetical protein